jgi:tRNA-dihydrouridine synthase
MAEARARVEETGCDGVMIGRGLSKSLFLRICSISVAERLRVMCEHTEIYEELSGRKVCAHEEAPSGLCSWFRWSQGTCTPPMECEDATAVRNCTEAFVKKMIACWIIDGNSVFVCFGLCYFIVCSLKASLNLFLSRK